MAKGMGSGYRNLNKRDVKVHQRAGMGLKTYSAESQSKYVREDRWQTYCPACGLKFMKNRWRFDSCPVCRNKNLREM